MPRRLAVVWLLVLALAGGASAQTAGPSGTASEQSPAPTSSSSGTAASRPATTTFFGDTGLWFVPTAEVLGQRKVGVSRYRRGTNWVQGYSNVADFDGHVAVVFGNRTELLGSFLSDTRIDRDVRPLFMGNNSTVGGIVDRYQRVTEYWNGDNVGDLFVGAKAAVRTEKAAAARAEKTEGTV
jgi:hypothetical protein